MYITCLVLINITCMIFLKAVPLYKIHYGERWTSYRTHSNRITYGTSFSQSGTVKKSESRLPMQGSTSAFPLQFDIPLFYRATCPAHPSPSYLSFFNSNSPFQWLILHHLLGHVFSTQSIPRDVPCWWIVWCQAK